MALMLVQAAVHERDDAALDEALDAFLRALGCRCPICAPNPAKPSETRRGSR